MYTTASLSQPVIIQYFTYTTGLGDFFFTTSSSGAGTMSRLDSRGGSDYIGLAKTTSWTHWNCPSSSITASKNTWYQWSIIADGSEVADYYSTSFNYNSLGTVINSLSSTYTDSCGGGTETYANNGNYIGLVGDGLGSSYVTYWQGIIVRAYPPNGVMPSISFGTPESITGIPNLAITPNPITYGGTSTITASGNPNTDTIELFMNGNLIGGPATGNIIYTFNSLKVGYGPGSYTFNAYDENSLKSNIGTLTVNKATPIISLPNFPQPFIYNGSSATITASLSSINNQLTGNIYINNTFLTSFTTSTSFTETNPNNYTVVANTIGNANYTAASVSNTLIICPQVSPLPSNIVAYSCIILNNSQATATSNPFQQLVNISEASFPNYIAYNNNFANFEFFYQNGTIIPAWIESNSSGTLHVWLKIKSIPCLLYTSPSPRD